MFMDKKYLKIFDLLPAIGCALDTYAVGSLPYLSKIFLLPMEVSSLSKTLVKFHPLWIRHPKSSLRILL